MTDTRDDLHRDTFEAPTRSRFVCGDAREVLRPGWSQLITPTIPLRWRNEVSLSVLGADADAVIEATVASYGSLGLPLRWLVGPPTRPVDTAEKLVKLGFSLRPIRGMAIDTTAMLPTPGNVVVRRMQMHDVQLWSDACSAGWGSPVSARIVSDWRWAFAQPERQFYLASIDGVPVGTAAVVLCNRIAYLVGGQVLAPYRGRGVYRALLAARLAAVRDARATATTLAVEATSAPILARLGFRTLFRCLECESPE